MFNIGYNYLNIDPTISEHVTKLVLTKWPEEIVFVRKDLSAHQESASILKIICNEELPQSRPFPSCIASFLEKHFWARWW